MPAGVFLDPDWPTEPGTYRYEPYRGGGHYQLAHQVRAGHMPPCHYVADGVQVNLVVVGIPASGLLELTDFRAERGNLPTPSRQARGGGR